MPAQVTWLKVQVAVVAAGTLLTAGPAAARFYRYLLIGGDLARFPGPPLANPLAMPCFYGAIGFVVALVWAVRQLHHPSAQSQGHLAWLMLAGTALGTVSLAYQCHVVGAAPCFRTVLDPIHGPCALGLGPYLAGWATAVAARASLVHQQPPGETDNAQLAAHHRVS